MKKIIIICILTIIFFGFYLYKKNNLLVQNPLNGEQTAQLISKLYSELGPRIGSHLVEPNVVLTIAGMRYGGDFLIRDLTNEEKAKIEKINNITKNLGIEFILIENLKDKSHVIMIKNLNGLEYSSRISNLPFVKPEFKKANGDPVKWSDEAQNKAEKYFKYQKNKYKTKENPLAHLFTGFFLGYPDQALLDMYKAIDEGLLFSDYKKFPLSTSKIPYSDYYENAQPNFSFFPEHTNEKSIIDITKSWGKLLEDFYHSSWHKMISKDPVFLETRKSILKADADWFRKLILNTSKNKK